MTSAKDTNTKLVDDVEVITRIDFSIYSDENIVADSVISEPDGITFPTIYGNNGEPYVNGVIDKRLGVTDRQRCNTCDENDFGCPGHFGHVKLVTPAFHFGYLPILKNIFSCICIKCHKLLVNKNEAHIDKIIKTRHGKQRFSEIRNACKSVSHCQEEISGCGTPAHKITINTKQTKILLMAEAIRKTTDTENAEITNKKFIDVLSPQQCYDILKSISNEDFEIMGFNPPVSRPDGMIYINFPIPPVTIRPSIKMDMMSNSAMDDDLTHKLVDIVKSNENLRDAKGDGSLSRDDIDNEDFILMQMHIATFFNNDKGGSQQKNKKPTKSVNERLKSKDGRVRGNLMGKRVNMSARTVITSDPYISINQVGVPLVIAKNLTYPEIVTPQNLAYLQELVKNGNRIYPGANYVIKHRIDSQGNETERVFRLKRSSTGKPIEIKPGDIVERQLVNGDVILFNRQPSLHKLSMMGHTCHIINDASLLTFRLSVNVTEPYNADFDGDEMNMHVPQSPQTVCEIQGLANVNKRFVKPSNSAVAIVAKQDSLLGGYIITRDGKWIDWKDAGNMLMYTHVGLALDIPKGMRIAARRVFSEIIPGKINIERNNSKGEVEVRIVNGKLLQGLVSKQVTAAIVQRSWNDYGGQVTQQFIDDLQRLTLQYLMYDGCSMGISDMVATREIDSQVHKIIETKRSEIMTIITERDNDPQSIDTVSFEIILKDNLKSVQDACQKIIMPNFDADNNLYNAIKSGSNGAEFNAVQIMGCIGQVIIDDKMIQKKFNNRTLPTFCQHDDSPFARGFCANGFAKGMNPMEFFFHIMSGREGLIASAIKTADTGYVERKLIKTLEDIKVEYDGTVRNANGKIIQYVYGDNGINTETQVMQKIAILRLNNKTVNEKYCYSDVELRELASKTYNKQTNRELYDKLIALRDEARVIQSRIAKPTSSGEFTEDFFVPVDVRQFVVNLCNRENRENKAELVDPSYVLEKLRLLTESTSSRIIKYLETSVIRRADDESVKFMLRLYLYDTLSPKKCTHLYKFSKSEFDEVITYFQTQLQYCKVEGGEMVGFVAAQSIGEPITQSNLKDFHRSGTGKSTSLGLPRIKEILSISQNIRTPEMEIVFQDAYRQDKIITKKIASHLKFTTLADIIDKAETIYDPSPNAEDSIMNQDGVDNVFQIEADKSGCQSDLTNLPWVIRIRLNKEKLLERNVTMLEIKTSFCHNWRARHEDAKGNRKDYKRLISRISQTAIITNYDNSPEPMVHIRYDAMNYDSNTLIQFQDLIINRYRIKGFADITESKDIFEKSFYKVDAEGGISMEKQYVVSTSGVNLRDITQINGINLEATTCNDIYAIYEMYGIEAARTAFIRELTIAIASSGVYSNYQHIELLADAITHMGGLIAVNRHGTNKLDTDPLSRSSFERTVDQLLYAAAFAESDYNRSISARVMMGCLIKGGTGCFDLLLDHDKIKKYLPAKNRQTLKPLLKKRNIVQDLIRVKTESKI